MKIGKILYHQRQKYIEWKIGDFASIFKKRDLIESPTFPFDDDEWSLQFCTDSVSGDSEYVSVYLIREGTHDLENCISGRIGIKKDDGTVYVSHTFDRRDFEHISDFIWFHNFVKISELSADMSEIAPRDEVTFFCWLSNEGCREMETQTEPEEVFKATGRDGSEEVQCASSNGTYKLAEDVKDLFLNGKNCDTTIKVANREFQAHRLILGARSPVFASMYSHNTTERSTGIVEIEDCDPDVFQDFLIFLYSGKLESLSLKNAFGLYAVADKYDVQDVKEECLKFMINDLSVEHFCEVMTFALKYSEAELLKSTTIFFVKNAKKISMTPNWLCFHKDYPTESNELHIKALERYDPE